MIWSTSLPSRFAIASSSLSIRSRSAASSLRASSSLISGFFASAIDRTLPGSRRRWLPLDGIPPTSPSGVDTPGRVWELCPALVGGIDTRRGPLWVGVLTLVLLVALFAGSAEAKKGASKFEGSVTPNIPIPDAVAVGPATPVISQIKVPKKFKGKVVGDVNVTGLQTTGSGANAAQGLTFKLTAPNGRTMQLTDNLAGVSIGPLTIDDDTRTAVCTSPTLNCSDPDQTLARPYAGTASMLGFANGGLGPLSSFNGSPMRGTWTLSVYDRFNPGQTSVLNAWGLKLKAAKPAGGSDSKKTKKFAASETVNASIPDDAATGPSTPAISQIKVPKKFKGKVIEDLNVTGIQTTGLAPDAADELVMKLTAPSGRTNVLFRFVGGGAASIGPLTLDDDTPISLGGDNAVCTDDPLRSLGPPYAGTANKFFVRDQGTGPLSTFDGVKVRGTWTLTAFDTGDAGQTSTLNSWGLEIRLAKPAEVEEK
jgi:subtilisin-like proprotein convertase family protein